MNAGWGGKRRLLILTSLADGVIAGIILCAAFGLSRGPLFSNYLNKYIPSERRATTLFMISMLRTLGIFAVNLSAGFLADWSVSLTMLIVGLAMLVVTLFSGIKEEHLLD